MCDAGMLPRAAGTDTCSQSVARAGYRVTTTIDWAETTKATEMAQRFVAGEEPLREVTMAKLLTQRACFELMDACLQIHGGAGYMREYWVERAARDARLGPIGGGSDEIMREILGRTLGL